MKSPSSLFKYFFGRQKFSQKKKCEKRVIFSISSGRAGSEYLKTLLESAEGVHAFHEAKPSMSGEVLTEAMNTPLSETYEKRLVKRDAILESLSQLPTGSIYAETNHMFIKTFYDIMLDTFNKECISVIILRRNLEEVLQSFIKMAYFSEKSHAWPLWMHRVPSSLSSFVPLKSYEEMDQYEKSICYLIDIEIKAQNFIRDHSDKCHIVEVELDKLQSFEQVANLFNQLDIEPTPSTHDVIGAVVNDRNARKEVLGIETDLEHCRYRIAKFLEEHNRAGIVIPELLQFQQASASSDELADNK